MTTNENKKNLLAANKNTLRGLHDTFGFDFLAPHDILFLTGNYTVKKIEKLAAAAGYSKDAEIVILTRDYGRRAWNRDFSAVEIVGGGVNIEFRRRVKWYKKGGRPFDTYCIKGMFEDTRKEASAETFIVCQEREFIKIPTEKKVDFSERFKVAEIKRAGDGKGGHWISGLELTQTTNNGARVHYGEQWYICHGWKPQAIEEVIDKSGYLLRERREDLKRRAAALRAERAKAAFMAADNSAKVEELRGMIESRKNELVRQLQQATTAEAVREVEKALCTWRGLGGIMGDFERFERNSTEKKYASIEEADRVYNGIKNALRGEAA